MKDQNILYIIGVIVLVVLLGVSLFNNNGLGNNNITNYESYENENKRDYSDIYNYYDQYIENIENNSTIYQEPEENNSSISDLISNLYKEYQNEQSKNQYDEGKDDENYNELNLIDFINSNTNTKTNTNTNTNSNSSVDTNTKTSTSANNNTSTSTNTNTTSNTDTNTITNTNTAVKETPKPNTQTISEPTFDSSQYSGYYYNYLSPIQKEIYGKIVDGCEKYETKIKLNKNEINDTSIAQAAILYDHPEFYWVTKSTIITQNNKVVEVECQVPADVKTKMEQVDRIVRQILSQSGSSEKDKIKYFYDWIVENTEYENTSESQHMLSVFLDGKSVCAGYSRAFQYLCQKSNIFCVYVPGITKENEPHAWNLVRISGKYYWVDVTWGDPTFAELDYKKTNYNYLLVSDKEFLNNHKMENIIRMDDGRTIPFIVNYPPCTDDSLNYYSQKGCYFDSYDKKTIEEYITKNLEEDNYTNIEFKFSSEEDYNSFLDDFFSGETPQIFDVLRKMKKFRNKTVDLKYYLVDEMYYIEISFTIY